MRPRVVQDSLSQRGGSWRLSYHLAFEDGTRGPRRFVTLRGCKGAREARRRAAAALDEIREREADEFAQTRHSTDVPTLLEAYKGHVDGLMRTGAIEPRTYAGYLQRAKRLGWIGDIRVCDIEAEDVRRYIEELNEDGYCTNSVNDQVAIIRQTLSRCERAGMVRRNVCLEVKVARRQETKPRSLQRSEKARLLTLLHALEGYLPLAIRLSLSLGLRRGEVCGLRWDAVDFAGGTVTVCRAISSDEKGRLYAKQPKTQRSTRRLPMEPGIRDALWQRRQEQAARCESLGVAFTDRLYVLGDVDGSFLSPEELGRRFTQFAKSMSIAGGECRFHWLRHTFATSLISQGVDVRTVAAWLGHADPGFTLRVYVDLDERSMLESVDAVARSLEVPEGAGDMLGVEKMRRKRGETRTAKVISWDQARRRATVS